MFETSFLYGCIKIFILLPIASRGNYVRSTENKFKIIK